MEIEQRYVIKFFIDEGMKSFDILMCLHKHYDSHVFSRSTLYFWIDEARRSEQTSQKCKDSAGLQMKVWRPSSPDDTKKIPICLREN
jgi:hypothetical protein